MAYNMRRSIRAIILPDVAIFQQHRSSGQARPNQEIPPSYSPIAISLGSYMDKAAGRRPCPGKNSPIGCLGLVSVMSRSCLGDVSVLSLSGFGDVSVFDDVSVLSR